MKKINLNRQKNKKVRHLKIIKTIQRIDNGLPKLIVTKTNSHIYAQLIDVNNGKVLASSSTLQLKLPNGNMQNAKKVGEDISKKITDKKISRICFDRNGSKYHGKIAIIAEKVREVGIKV